MTSKAEASPARYWEKGTPILPNVPFANCPIATSLGILGGKWTMLIIRDIAMRKQERFSELLKSIPGITPRVLSMRLRELEAAQMITKITERKSPRLVRWNFTEKGRDILPVLMSYVAFGSKWFATTVFEDGESREIREIYLQENLKNSFVNIEVNKRKIKELQKTSTKVARSWTGYVQADL